MRAAFVGFGLLIAVPAFAQDVPSDAGRYIARREACNYWPYETAPRHSLRAHEIERHTRNLHCDTLDHELAILEARYSNDGAVLGAMRNAHDAVPED
jgi:hypothetical protein